ncbi:MAG TPA: hypothetical protein VEJ63_10270, partial [Planctomycetota bacterium]|nr:hypothetical protein [Planctomycetota bacterium]
RAQYPGIQSVSTVEFLDARGGVLGNGGLGRATLVRIGHNGGTMQMQGNAFRLLVSPRDLKSLLIEQAADRGESVELAGGGFGHGVGMCQFGSQGMALSGRTYPEILGMYFPGAALTKMW